MMRAYLIVCLAWAPLLLAQGGESTQILGVVEDSSGAVIPGVTVTATHLATGQTRSAVTRESGTYVFALMAPGEYNLRAEMQGFKVDVKTGLILQLNQKARVDFRLQIGAVSKTVRVIEGHRLQFRYEVFNVWNTPQFRAPNAQLGGPAFGQITSTWLDNRQMQFALKYLF